MKAPILATVLATATLTPAFAQKAGDAVTTEALGKLKWIQGEAPTDWEPGKLYILECWATWCGPCIAAIPHVDHLHDTFQEKGLRVIGVNVWEDDPQNVTAFVEKKGDGMSYPVAYTGRGGAFETAWLKPAGVRGIPHAFVVRDGKVLFTAHPSQLSDDIISDLLAGGEKSDAAITSIQNEATRRDQISKAFIAFRQAAPKNDIEGMKTALAQLRESKAQPNQIASLELELSLRSGNFDDATQKIAALPDDATRPQALAGILRTAISIENVPASFSNPLADQILAANPTYLSPHDFQNLSRTLWNNDRKADALKAAENAEKKAAEFAAKNPNVIIPTAAFSRWTQSLKEDKLPTTKEFGAWYAEESKKIRESRTQQPPAAPAPLEKPAGP